MNPAGTTQGVERLINALRNRACYAHPVSRIEILETHISWVVLTGDYAYKIKKPVNLGFLDFTTLEARRHFCEEELRLNRRLAPQIYVATTAITGSYEQPIIGGSGEAIEYAVVMREFPQSALLDAVLARGELDFAVVDVLARNLAGFHARAENAAASSTGAPEANTFTLACDNFSQMLPLLTLTEDIATLDALREWTLRENTKVHGLIRQRMASDHRRECHGDLHLSNLALLDGIPTPFDCLEFASSLRWLDVLDEAAFLMMDLEAHGRRDLAYVLINSYLEASGDYGGIGVLPFYLVYRALVRAKINLIRTTQCRAGPVQAAATTASYKHYIAVAQRYSEPRHGAIIITHGLSGSGKTRVTQALLGPLGAIRVRSDIERKRLHELSALARTGAATGTGIYTTDATLQTYDLLKDYARNIAAAGFPAIIDATFLKRAQRTAFRVIAQELNVPCAILSLSAPPETLRARIRARFANELDASEATEAVLESQIASCEALDGDESSYAVVVDAERNITTNAADACAALTRMLRSESVIGKS